MCVCGYLCVFLFIDLSIYPSIYPSIYLSASLKTKLFCETFLFFELDNVKNEAILGDIQLLHLTTSNTKRFCETSSMFKVGNIKNKAILRDFLQKWKAECGADGLVPMRFTIFPLHLSKVLRLPRKIDARSYEVLHLSRKIIFHYAPKCNPSQEISALTS